MKTSHNLVQQSYRVERKNNHPVVPEPRRLNGRLFRVLGRIDRLNRLGQGCTRLELGCFAGTATALLRHDAFLPRQREIHHGDIVQISGELHALKDRHYIKVEQLTRQQSSVILRPTALLPREWVLPVFLADLHTVIQHWQGIQHPALQQFLSSAFLDTSTAMGFLNAPGSLRHHHSYQGGLLEHTADMLNRISRYPDYYHPSQERDLATVLILVHDIGKTVTLVGQGRNDASTERGGYQPHDMAALELLAAPFAQLETMDSSLANRIRGYFKPKHWYPKKTEQVHERVAKLDRESVQASQYITASPP